MDEPEENPYRSPRSSIDGGSQRFGGGHFPTGAVMLSGGVVMALLFSNSFDVDTDPPWRLSAVFGCTVFVAAIAAALIGLVLITVRLFDER